MRLISPLTILALTPSAIAATVQFCTGFEGRSLLTGHSPGINVTVHDENCTLLMFRSNDFAWGLEGSVDLDAIKPVDDDAYPICLANGDHWKGSYCYNHAGLFDLDITLQKKIIWPVIATKLSPGESQNYTVPSAGAYCVVIRQDSAETVDLSGIDIHVSHSYGDFPLTVLLSLKVAVVAVLVLLFHAYLIPYAFPNTPLEHRYGFWKLLKLSLQGKLVVWLIHTFYLEWFLYLDTPVFPPVGPLQLSHWYWLDHALSLALVSVLYALWNVVACRFASGFYYICINESSPRYEFASTRLYWAIVTTIVVSSVGQILTHCIIESGSFNGLLKDIDASLMAVIFSATCKPKLGPKLEASGSDHHTVPPPYVSEQAAVEPDFEDVHFETTYLVYTRDGLFGKVILLRCIALFGSYTMLDTVLLQFLSKKLLGIGFPYLNPRENMNMTYHHVIWLNVVGNWLASCLLSTAGSICDYSSN